MTRFRVLLILIIALVVKAIADSRSSTPPDHQDSPQAILKARNTHDEIGEEEYMHRRSELEKITPVSPGL